MKNKNNIVIPKRPIQPIKTSIFSKINLFKYLFIIFIVLLTSVIFFIFVLNNKNPKQFPIKKNNNPSWVNELLKKETNDSPASLIKCFYKDNIVYYVSPRCCDIPSTLYDEEGNVICSPDGGFSGKGDEKCTDFFDTRKDCVTIWEDTE